MIIFSFVSCSVFVFAFICTTKKKSFLSSTAFTGGFKLTTHDLLHFYFQRGDLQHMGIYLRFQHLGDFLYKPSGKDKEGERLRYIQDYISRLTLFPPPHLKHYFVQTQALLHWDQRGAFLQKNIFLAYTLANWFLFQHRREVKTFYIENLNDEMKSLAHTPGQSFKISCYHLSSHSCLHL